MALPVSGAEPALVLGPLPPPRGLPATRVGAAGDPTDTGA